MKHFLETARLELAVVAFCAWQASGLLTAWRHSPFDQRGWLSFLVWLAPVVMSLARPAAGGRGIIFLTAIAFATSLAGIILDLNALRFASLALALAAFAPLGPRRIIWLASGLAWMPAYGWLAHTLPINAVAASRPLLAMAATVWLLLPPRTLRPA